MLLGMTDSFGRRLQRARKLAGITKQQTLGDLIGVSQKTIRNWETDRVNPENISPEHRLLLREVLGPWDDEGDAVIAAIKRTELMEWRQGALISEYQRHVAEQEAHRSGATG